MGCTINSKCSLCEKRFLAKRKFIRHHGLHHGILNVSMNCNVREMRETILLIKLFLFLRELISPLTIFFQILYYEPCQVVPAGVCCQLKGVSACQQGSRARAHHHQGVPPHLLSLWGVLGPGPGSSPHCAPGRLQSARGRGGIWVL